MNALDLDQLRARWAEQNRSIDDSLVLDVDAVRAMLDRRASVAFTWYRRRQVIGLAVGGGCVAALLAFIALHWGQWDWVAMAGLLLPLLLAEVVIDLREWRTLRELDLGAPVTRVRNVLHALRWRRLRLAKGYLLFSVLLWWPFVLVLFKALLGADLLRWLPPVVLLANLAVGLAFIPLALLVSWSLTRWFGHRPGWQRFMDDSAGMTWRRTSDEIAAREAFEASVADGSVQEAFASSLLPEDIQHALRALRQRLLAGILGCAALMVLLSLFNLGHGGQAVFLVPGLVLFWSVLAHMAVQILNRTGLSHVAGGTAMLRERLAGMLALRRQVAVVTLVLSPIGAMLLAVVLGKVAFGADIIQHTPPPVLGSIFLLALSASALLAWRAYCKAVDFAPRLLDAISLGFIGRARRLLSKLPDVDPAQRRTRSID